jgi:peptide subunit release factor 1 (eRF1)
MTAASPPDVPAIAALRDPLGVLSVYVDVDPGARSGGRPAWEIEIDNALRELEAATEDRHVRERVAALRPAVEALLDPSRSGRGRALFAALSSGETIEVTLPLPLRTAVVLDETAYLRALLETLEAARPAGVVSVSRADVEAIDWRLGTAAGSVGWEFDADTSEWREYKGPAGGSRAQQTAPQRDRFERRLEEHQVRFVTSLAPRIEALAREHGWSTVLVGGDPRLREPFVKALPAVPGLAVLALDAVLGGVRAGELGDLVNGRLEEARLERHRSLAEQAVEQAQAGAAAALGLQETLAALEEGRVAELLLDRDRRWEGLRDADGNVYAPGAVPPGVDPALLVPEPFLGERMIERAAATSAAVVLLDPGAAEPLAAAEGVGALLRW